MCRPTVLSARMQPDGPVLVHGRPFFAGALPVMVRVLYFNANAQLCGPNGPSQAMVRPGAETPSPGTYKSNRNGFFFLIRRMVVLSSQQGRVKQSGGP